MTIEIYRCEEGERFNATIIENEGTPIIKPSQTRADYPYRVVAGTELLSEGEAPWEKLVEVTECSDRYAEVKIVGDSLRSLVE